MFGSTLFEVFGRVIVRITCSVGEQLVDTNEDLRNSETFGYTSLRKHWLVWNGTADLLMKFFPPPNALDPDALLPMGTYETKTAVRTGKRSVPTILLKNTGLWTV